MCPIFLSQETQRGREQQTTPARNESKRCCSDNSRHVTILPRRRKQYQVIQTHGCSPSARRVSKGKMTTMKRKRPGTTQPASNQPPDLQQLAIDPAQFSRRIREKNLPRCSTHLAHSDTQESALFLSRLSGARLLPKDSGLPVHSARAGNIAGKNNGLQRLHFTLLRLALSHSGVCAHSVSEPECFNGLTSSSLTHTFGRWFRTVVKHQLFKEFFARLCALCFPSFCINGVRFSLSGARSQDLGGFVSWSHVAVNLCRRSGSETSGGVTITVPTQPHHHSPHPP